MAEETFLGVSTKKWPMIMQIFGLAVSCTGLILGIRAAIADSAIKGMQLQLTELQLKQTQEKEAAPKTAAKA